MLLLPDPLHDDRQLSAASLLWFDEPLLVTIPAQVVTPESFEILDLIRDRSPAWGSRLGVVLETWKRSCTAHDSMHELLEPLGERIRWVWLVYPGGSEALGRADALLAETGLEEELLAGFDPLTACGELVRHIFLELWAECEEEKEALYRQCEQALAVDNFEAKIARAYLLRMGAFAGSLPSPLLLSNERLLPFLLSMDKGSRDSAGSASEVEAEDVVGFEVFRRLISPRLDPLSESGVSTVVEIVTDRKEELAALKRQSLVLAEGLGDLPRTDIAREVAALVERHVAEELSALLRLSKRARQEYLMGLAADKTIWTGALALAAGAVSGSPEMSAAGGLAAVASALSTGVKAGWEHHKDVRDNPYRMLRRLPDPG